MVRMSAESRVSLDALLADPTVVNGVSSEQAAALLGRLSIVQALLVERLATLQAPGRREQAPPSSPAPVPPAWSEDDLLTVDEAAAMLRVSPRWLYRHAKTLPFTRKLSPKVLRFSRAGMLRWLAPRRT